MASCAIRCDQASPRLLTDNSQPEMFVAERSSERCRSGAPETRPLERRWIHAVRGIARATAAMSTSRRSPSQLTDRFLEREPDASGERPTAEGGAKIERLEGRAHACGDAVRGIGKRAVEVEDRSDRTESRFWRDRQRARSILADGTPPDVGVKAVGAVLMPAHGAAQHVDPLAFRSRRRRSCARSPARRDCGSRCA